MLRGGETEGDAFAVCSRRGGEEDLSISHAAVVSSLMTCVWFWELCSRPSLAICKLEHGYAHDIF